MENNISARTNSTNDTLFQQDDELFQEINNLFVDLDKISESIESINTDEGILPNKNPEIQTIFCNSIIVPKNKENVLNKKRKNILKTYKKKLPKKIKVKISYNDIKLDKYGIQTFTEESQEIISTQQILDNPDLSTENSITKEIVISPFNYKIFKENGNNYKSIKFDEPLFISFEYILTHYKKYIEKLWSKENKIFENENDLENTLNNGIIYKNVFIYLSQTKWNKADKRKFDADGMIKKIKTQLLESIRNYINSFDVMKYCEIYKLKKDSINNIIKANFNLIYLTQELYNIFSNDSSNKNHNSNKDKILKIKKQNFSFFNKHFCLTIQKCLDIFRYEEQNLHFKNRLVEFLIKQYKEFKDDIKYRKDYIASLILLVYNLERFFYSRLPDYLKNKAK